jgi:hypothetical protein
MKRPKLEPTSNNANSAPPSQPTPIDHPFQEANVNPTRPRDTDTVLIKTALDQVVYASVGTVVFFTVITLLEGRPAAVPAVVAAKFWPTLIANYAIWPVGVACRCVGVSVCRRVGVS